MYFFFCKYLVRYLNFLLFLDSFFHDTNCASKKQKQKTLCLAAVSYNSVVKKPWVIYPPKKVFSNLVRQNFIPKNENNCPLR